MNNTRVTSTKPPMCNVRHHSGFLSAHKCQELIAAFDQAAYNNLGRATGVRTEIDGVHLREWVEPVREAAKIFIAHRIDLQGNVIYPEYTMLSKMYQGDSHSLHADAVTLNGEPNHTHWRSHAAMIYLSQYNYDYSGGEIFFPQFGIEYGPAAGTIVAFTTDYAHRHEVREVLAGERYTLAVWFTTDSTRAERWT